MGVYSDPDQFTTLEDGKPQMHSVAFTSETSGLYFTVPTAPPQNITNIIHSSRSVTFNWSPPPPREINGLLRVYITELLERYTNRELVLFAIDAAVSINSLHPYYLYDFKVTAYTVGQGPFSDVVTVLTDEEVPTAPPQDITADVVTSTSMTLTWNPPPFENTNGFIRYYMIQITEVETLTSFTRTSNTTEITVEDLHPYYTYECTIAAHTIDVGPYSDVITIQLFEDGESCFTHIASLLLPIPHPTVRLFFFHS